MKKILVMVFFIALLSSCSSNLPIGAQTAVENWNYSLVERPTRIVEEARAKILRGDSDLNIKQRWCVRIEVEVLWNGVWLSEWADGGRFFNDIIVELVGNTWIPRFSSLNELAMYECPNWYLEKPS